MFASPPRLQRFRGFRFRSDFRGRFSTLCRIGSCLGGARAWSRWAAAWGIFAVAMCWTAGVQADEPPAIEFNLLRLRSSETANETLRNPTRFLWDQQPLRDALGGLSQAHEVSLWIDRRIDPSQPMNYSPAEAAEASACWPKNSLGARLEQVANSIAVEAGLVENVLVFAPAGETAKLQSAAVRLHDAIHRHDPRLASQLRPLQWPELITSQQLLEQIAQQWGVQIEGQLPHDLLHAGSLRAPSSLATQLTLACGGFDRCVESTGKQSFAVRPLPATSTWMANYSKEELKVSALGIARSAYPGGSMRCGGEQCSLRGVTNFHLALRVASRARTARSGGGRTVWSFEIADAPAEAILDNIAAGVGLEIVWDPSCTAEHRSRLLSLKVTQASLDELLEQVCTAAGLDFTRSDKLVTLRPAASKR